MPASGGFGVIPSYSGDVSRHPSPTAQPHRTPENALSADWQPDHLLDRYQLLTIPLGPDPDGEDPITATLISKPGTVPAPRGAVLYVHGFTDYFFHEPLADFYHDRGFAFYALDLRKCGRSRAEHHTAHFTTDLRQYDEELGLALTRVLAELESVGAPGRVVVNAHSTGGLIAPLWLDRLRQTDPALHAHVDALVLNSPWLDLQGPAIQRSLPASLMIRAISTVRPKTVLPQKLSEGYGRSLHNAAGGEWAYDLRLKPHGGFPVTFGFLHAVRSGHAHLHRGIDVGVPSLVLRSDRTVFRPDDRGTVNDSDVVLDSRQIARWSGCLGNRVTVVPITDARHDVFLSVPHSREIAYRELDEWIDRTVDDTSTTGEASLPTEPETAAVRS